MRAFSVVSTASRGNIGTTPYWSQRRQKSCFTVILRQSQRQSSERQYRRQRDPTINNALTAGVAGGGVTVVVSSSHDQTPNPAAPSSLNQQENKDASTGNKKNDRVQFSWVHFLAGGTGGMVGALVTSPLDVVKTRLQSSLYKNAISGSTNVPRSGVMSVLGHIKDTFVLLGHIYTHEGPRALYKGLGPNLVGVIPARAIAFATYGNGKKYLTALNNGNETALVHLASAAIAGVVTATATNPIWMVKTRMQLQSEGKQRIYRNSLHCVIEILRTEGIRGLYKGLAASLLGVTEGAIQWVIYEHLKKAFAERRAQLTQVSNSDGYQVGGKNIEEWGEYLGAAGTAKFVASAITYPHEVLRTRMRQTPQGNEAVKYTGLVQTFRLVLKEEGIAALYGGLTAHMLRVVPNAAIMFFCYEAILHRFG
ncbi:hypothetical protein BGZ46_004640 [Entomortierella lignicola]|nr:hypothetical protein BGZ46_004640 [Entomortierella lignicola]